MNEKKENKSFLLGAAILAIAGLLVQVLGAFFRIPLANIIGEEGMGYYQTAYPIYVFLLVFSTNGAPAAISKMTSERLAIKRADEAHRVFNLSFYLMAVFGFIAFLAIFFGAPVIIRLTSGHPNSILAMRAIAPALLLVPIMSVYRGYFQGMQNMLPTALSQLSEQLVRVALGLVLAYILMERSTAWAAAGATLGTSIGPIFGILILLIIYRRARPYIHEEMDRDCARLPEGAPRESVGSILKKLVLLSIPITFGVSILPIMNMADMMLVMGRLQAAGFHIDEANALYGQLSGLAGPVINIPMSLALSMALAMVPTIAAAKASGDEGMLSENVRLGLRTAVLIGVPCSFGLMALAKPIMLLLYPSQSASAESSSLCLFILAFGVAFLCAALACAGTLQGVDKAGAAVWTLIAAFIIKCLATFLLSSIPSLGVHGAAIGSCIGYAAVGILNYFAVRKLTGISFDKMKTFVKPIISGLIMFFAVELCFRLVSIVFGNTLSTLISIVFGVLVYGIAIVVLKAVDSDEIERFPKGKTLAKIMRRLRLI